MIAKSEPEQILEGVSLAGNMAVVTGGYSGIGLETTRALAARGAKVYVPVRDRAKAEQQLSGIEGEVITAFADEVRRCRRAAGLTETVN